MREMNSITPRCDRHHCRLNALFYSLPQIARRCDVAERCSVLRNRANVTDEPLASCTARCVRIDKRAVHIVELFLEISGEQLVAFRACQKFFTHRVSASL